MFSVLFFLLAVGAVCYLAFWLIGHLNLTPPFQKFATVIVVLVGLAALAYKYAGGIIPR